MTTKRMILNETSYFGAGSRSSISDEIKKRGFKKALIITDKDLSKTNVIKLVTEVLAKSKIPYDIFDKVKQNPTINNVKQGVEALEKSKADFILAVGGGSPLDTAKAVGIISSNKAFANVKSLEGKALTSCRSLPIIAVPTTAGTASEVTMNYVITDEERIKKMVCVDPHTIPIVAIIDPELMISMPPTLTAATGMDALTHAIEGYITKDAWEMSDMFEIAAIELIGKHLRQAVNNPSDLPAREGMALAQYIAGMGFSNVGLGIVHSMAHPLGAMYDIPHGLANAVLLPYIMEFNSEASGKKYIGIGRAIGVKGIDEMTVENAIAATLDAVKQLSRDIGIPSKLKDIGVREEDLQKLSVEAFNDICTSGNPRYVDSKIIYSLYQKAY